MMVFCIHCGAQTVRYATFCSVCGKPLHVLPEDLPPETNKQDDASTTEQTGNNPNAQSSIYAQHFSSGLKTIQVNPVDQIKNYLVESILVTIFCCWPLGVAGIYFAAQVNSRIAMGDFNGAVSASNQAKTFVKYSFIIGLIIQILYFTWYGFIIYTGLNAPE
jgi:hypothetical protein